MNSIHESRPVTSMNQSNTMYKTTYPTCRPLKIYRKTGAHSVSATPYCSDCKTSIRVGKQYKMLGKTNTGELLPVLCDEKYGQGNVFSFSGRNSIRSSLNNTTTIYPNKTPPAKPYFANYASYLKGRGNTYTDKSKFNILNPINNSYCETNPESTDCGTCFRTIYNPNNPTFKTQGAVDGSTYVDRQKYNAIAVNNRSFYLNYGVKLNYQETPIYFVKNKINKCTNNCM